MVFRDVRDRIEKSFTSAFRRYFVNTIFDSTFVLLGIVIGSAFSDNPDLETVVVTMLLTSLSLGISTATSIYEAEALERDRRITELEKFMFRKLHDTDVEWASKVNAAIISLLNFFTPLFSFSIIASPFLLVILGFLDISQAGWVSIFLALTELFAIGSYLGRSGRRPYLKGLRMLLFGLLAFAIGYLLESLI